MTCIIALKENNNIFIGADSLGTSDSFIYNRADSKIIRNGEFLIGVAGSIRTRQILQYMNFPKCNDWDIEKYMCTNFIDSIRNSIYNVGNMQERDGIQFTDDSDIIVIFRDRIFKIEVDFQVAWNQEPYMIIGSGTQVATGAMEILLDMNLSSKDKIFKAITTASKYINSVGGNIIIEKY